MSVVNSNNTIPSKKNYWLAIGKICTWLGLIVFIWAFVFGYFHAININRQLAMQLSQDQTMLFKQGKINNYLSEKISSQTAALDNFKQMLLQQKEQLNHWQDLQSGHKQLWQLAEIQFLVRLAQNALIYQQNNDLALNLLTNATTKLAQLNNPALISLEKNLQSSIKKLQGSENLSSDIIFQRLMTADNAINQLQLPPAPLAEPENNKIKLQDEHIMWWQLLWQRVTNALSRIVLIQYQSSDKMPLVLPQEQQALYQNLHSQLQNAVWAAIHHHQQSYELALQQLKHWVGVYMQQNQQAKSFLAEVDALAKIKVSVDTIDLTAVLRQLDNYLMQNMQTVN